MSQNLTIPASYFPRSVTHHERPSSEAAPRPGAIRRESSDDVVDLSATARRTVGEVDPPAVREELIQRIRAQIAAGNYLTDDKLDTAVDRLYEEITSGSNDGPAF